MIALSRFSHVKPAAWLSALFLTTAGLPAQTNGATDFLKTKYGFFVHYVWGGSQDQPFTIDRDGKRPATFDEFAAAFDAAGFARDLEKWGVEYVILTAWHYNINPLFPSETMKKWGLEKHTCKRDVLRDVITACKAKNIKVMLYTHPRDGHDLSLEDQMKTGWGGPNGTDPKWENFDRKKWNDFTCELYAELVSRYGKDIIGVYCDEGSAAGDSYRVVDYPRLRKTIKSIQPDLHLLQNWYGTTYSLDGGCKEYAYWGEFTDRNANAWPTYQMSVGTIMAASWYATKPAGVNVVTFQPDGMFRYTVMQAGANTEGGGVIWAAGNYAKGGWETGVAETMERISSLVKPIAPSLTNVYSSTSYPTAPGVKLPDLKWGVATRAVDDSIEYLHILTPPSDGSLTLSLPPPADGKKFEKAVLLAKQKPVALKQDATGLQLKLPAGESWDPLNTVIALKVSAASPATNLAFGKAFSASSFPDPTAKGGSAWAFAAVDGKLGTAWTSRPDGESIPGNQPVAPDAKPWCRIDLGQSATISAIKVHGAIGSGVELQVSPSADFSRAVTVATSPASQPTSRLTIVKASYGKGAQVVDVTASLQAAAATGVFEIRVDNALCGSDPAPNVVKELVVESILDGNKQTVTIPETQNYTLGTAPSWDVPLKAVTKARYVRLIRKESNTKPMIVNEFEVFGQFQSFK